MTPVKSSNIAAVGYYAEGKTLTVQFKTGAVHKYEDVGSEKHTAMMSAPSVGKYFHANVKGVHKQTKV